MKLTDWIPCKKPPVREGWFDVDLVFSDGRTFQERRYYWRLGDFRLSERDMIRAPVIYSQDRWRGAAEKQS